MKNTQNYWYKRRRYGYGWVPVTREGWAVILLFLILVLAGLLPLTHVPQHRLAGRPIGYIIYILVLTAILYYICREKGPAPKWRWGKRAGDNPNEDF